MTKASRDYAHYQHIFKFYFIFSIFYLQVSSKKTLAFSLVCCFTLLYLSSQTSMSLVLFQLAMHLFFSKQQISKSQVVHVALKIMNFAATMER